MKQMKTPQTYLIMCCLLVLDSVASTPQWIRQPRPRVYLKEGSYISKTPSDIFEEKTLQGRRSQSR